MKRLPLDTVLTLMRRENVLGHGFDLGSVIFLCKWVLPKSK